MVMAPDGTVLGKMNDDGSIAAPGPGDTLYPQVTEKPDGTVVGPDGKPIGVKRADGTVVDAEGRTVGYMAPDGSIKAVGAAEVLCASTTTTPDGTVLGGDGKPLGKLRPDGMVVGEDGRVLGKMASDGSIVKA